MRGSTRCRLGALLALALAGAAPAQVRAADPDLVQAFVREHTADPRHVSALDSLSYVHGSDEEKTAFVGALGQIEANFRDSTLWEFETAGDSTRAAFQEWSPLVLRTIDSVAVDILGETAAPGSPAFRTRWAPTFATRFPVRDDPEVALRFDHGAVPIDPLSEPLAIHFWFAHEALAEVWNRFASASAAPMVRAALRRERLWSSFNDIAYSLYPWEQLLNRWFVDYGELDQFPSWLLIVAHPSVAVEVGTFGQLGIDHPRDVRASEVFLVECGAQFLRRAGGRASDRFRRSIGFGAVLGVADDTDPGFGGLIHYGTTIHLGALHRPTRKLAGEKTRDRSWTALVGLDLYGLLGRGAPRGK